MKTHKIHNWITTNKLTLNTTKTKYIIFKTSNNAQFTISYNGTRLERVNEIKYLGVYIDSELNWKTHINKTISNLAAITGIFKKIGKFVPKEQKRQLYFAMINSRATYGITSWYSAFATTTKPLQTLQNKAIKNIFGYENKESTKKIHEENHIMTIKQNAQNSLAIHMHNIIPNCFQVVILHSMGLCTPPTRPNKNLEAVVCGSFLKFVVKNCACDITFSDVYNMFSLIKKHFNCPEINRFEGIDFETFVTLESDAIKEVIPEVIPRLNFITQYKGYLRTIDLQTINESDISNSIVVESDNNREWNWTDINSVNSLPLESYSGQSSLGVFSTNELNLVHESSDAVESNQSVNKKLLLAVRSITTPKHITDIPSIELKIIIKRYSQKGLENADRVEIGKEIIRYLLYPNPERVITREEFQQIAENIVKLLPNEIATCYYTESLGTVQAQGKLFTAYNKLKGRLRDVGLIGKRPKKSMKSVGTEKQLYDPGQSEFALKFLSAETDDFEKVKHYWIMSHKQRSDELLRKLKTLDYINTFPIFNQPRAFELLSIDASLMFPNIESTLIDVSKKVLTIASGLQNRSLDMNLLLEELNYFGKTGTADKAIVEVQQQLVALRLIPHLLKESHKRKGKTEADVSFYTSYKSIVEAEENDKNTGNAVPYMNLIEDAVIPRAQVVISGRKFVLDDPLAGFDVLFKSYLALSLNYPDECKHLWLFIQKCVYNVHKDSDLTLPNVTALIDDISNVSDGLTSI